jgi:hypothetical protein
VHQMEPLGVHVEVMEIYPRPGAATTTVEEAVQNHLVALLDAPLSRLGNLTGVALLRTEASDRYLLLIGQDLPGPRVEDAVTEIGQVSEIRRIGQFVPVVTLARGGEDVNANE